MYKDSGLETFYKYKSQNVFNLGSGLKGYGDRTVILSAQVISQAQGSVIGAQT